LSDIPPSSDPRVLVDFRTADDAGVYAWEGGPALVQTVDFFTPIVDDPYLYGQIAAANSLSDVYAMGGEPRTALAIAAFPKDGLDPSEISAIFRGGFDKLREAGTALLGGHTVQDSEIKFGYAVTGAVPADRILTNAGARVGDTLLLTKAIGTGVIGTAIKAGRAPADVVDRAARLMATLNKIAAETMVRSDGVHACTDITGFGLLGHTSEVAAASAVSVELVAAAVPLIDGAAQLVSRNRSGGMATNREHFGGRTKLAPSIERDLQDLLFDPQTSGGLLIAVAGPLSGALKASLTAAGVIVSEIGRVGPSREDGVLVSVV
jgi:selenide, water dikinase